MRPVQRANLLGRSSRLVCGDSRPVTNSRGTRPCALLIFPLANCFWWVAGGLRPPATHQKLFSDTGRERRHPAKARTRPPPRYAGALSANQMNLIQREGICFWNRGSLTSFPERTVLCAWWAGFARPPRTQNSLYARGENTGTPPRCGPVRRQLVTHNTPPILTSPNLPLIVNR